MFFISSCAILLQVEALETTRRTGYSPHKQVVSIAKTTIAFFHCLGYVRGMPLKDYTRLSKIFYQEIGLVQTTGMGYATVVREEKNIFFSSDNGTDLVLEEGSFFFFKTKRNALLRPFWELKIIFKNLMFIGYEAFQN